MNIHSCPPSATATNSGHRHPARLKTGQGEDICAFFVSDAQDGGRGPPPVGHGDQPKGQSGHTQDGNGPEPPDSGRHLRLHRYIIAAVWLAFAGVAIAAHVRGSSTLSAVAILSLVLSVVPVMVAARLRIVLPLPFVVALALFLVASLLLGEAFDMYERIWWWDIALHGASAIGLGMAGFLFVFMLFDGDRFAAPAWGLVLIAACMAVTLGVVWELFEYAMDSAFGLTMLKSGLDDTMGDILTDVVGGILGALVGGLYLKGRDTGFVTILVVQFVRKNRHRFPLSRRKTPGRPPR